MRLLCDPGYYIIPGLAGQKHKTVVESRSRWQSGAWISLYKESPEKTLDAFQISNFPPGKPHRCHLCPRYAI